MCESFLQFSSTKLINQTAKGFARTQETISMFLCFLATYIFSIRTRQFCIQSVRIWGQLYVKQSNVDNVTFWTEILDMWKMFQPQYSNLIKDMLSFLSME